MDYWVLDRLKLGLDTTNGLLVTSNPKATSNDGWGLGLDTTNGLLGTSNPKATFIDDI
jgi:hypothetical protein